MANGELVFSDRQATRMERAMANMWSLALARAAYQPSEFIKRFLPQGTFDLLITDEAHEYKNGGSAQGRPWACWRRRPRKTLLLTGTLMGGYGDDLFYLLFRALPRRMIEDGYRPTTSGSMTSAAMAFMRDHGVLKDITPGARRHGAKTAKAPRYRCARSAPGFGPKGRCAASCRSDLSQAPKDIGGNVLPPYDEEFRKVQMDVRRKLRPTAIWRSADRRAETGSGATRYDLCWVWCSTCCWPGRIAASGRRPWCIAHAQHPGVCPGSVQ